MRTRPGPYFFALCDEAARVDALGAMLSALVNKRPDDVGVRLHPAPEFRRAPIDEAVPMLRAHFREGDVEVFFRAALSSGKSFDCVARCYTDESHRSRSWGPLHVHPCARLDFSAMEMILAWGSGPSSVGPGAVLVWHEAVDDLVDLLLRVCAPDASGRVSTGGCTTAWTWLAPVSMCATYHADANDIARDLALSWVSLHDGESVSRIADLSMEALRARVAAAPAGARVVPRDNSERAIPLARETVLKALVLPGSALLEALIAAAEVPDEAWRAAEPRAKEIYKGLLQAQERGARLSEVFQGPPPRLVEVTGEHVDFLVDHAPFHIHRLPSGGVVIATHFYRTLWPLWADALFSLGITS